MQIRTRRISLVLVLGLIPTVVGAATWPAPPLPARTTTDDVAKHIVFNGLDMRAQVFQSQQSPTGIIAFYRKVWDKQVVVNKLGNAQVIGHQDGDYYITVQVSKDGSGSKGNIGIIDTSSAPKHFVPGKGIPQPMGSRVFNDIRYPDDAVPARTVAMRNGLSPQQNATYFRERLAADGWKPADANRCAQDRCVMYYARGDSKMTLVMSLAEGHSQVVINVMDP